MKNTIAVGAAGAILALWTSSLAAQPAVAPPNWESWKFLLGEWVGEGTGQPGEASGGFTFQFELQGRVLIRKNHADYPATPERPAFSHEDLMIVYQEPENHKARADYFDNEGHVIHYAAELSNDKNTLTFVSDPSPKEPRYRFSYIKAGGNEMKFRFEIAPQGQPEAFVAYVQGSVRRKATK